MVITSEQYIIASLTTTLCIFGFIFNGMALLLLLRLPELKNAFGYMCTSHIISNIGVLLCFLFWGVPMTLFKSELAAGNVGKAIAGIAVLCWEVSIYSHVFVALNRFVAIYMPIQYMSIFGGKRMAFIFIFLSWFLASFYALPFFITGCGMHYTVDTYLWLYDETSCSQWMAKWMDFYSSCFWVFVIGISDIVNVIKIIGMWRGLNTSTTSGRRKRRETMFFAQAFCQNLLFAAASFFFPTATFWVSDTVPTYMLTTFLWGSVHAMDGLILTVFNFGMHRKKVAFNLRTYLKQGLQNSSEIAQQTQNQNTHGDSNSLNLTVSTTQPRNKLAQAAPK